MGERIPAKIHIGGSVAAEHVAALIGVLEQEGARLEWGGEPFKAKNAAELLELARDDNGHPSCLVLYDEWASWGEFQELEPFLIEHTIGFDRFSDAVAGYPAERSGFRPGMEAPKHVPTDEGGDPVLPFHRVADLAALVNGGEIEQARHEFDKLDDEYRLPELEPLRITAVSRARKHVNSEDDCHAQKL